MNDEKMIELLTEAVRWLRFQSIDKAKAAVGEHLNTGTKKRVFELTDGISSARAIEERTGAGIASISNWWNAWYSAGIVIRENGRYKQLFKLSDLGIEVADSIEKSSKKNK